MTTGHDDMPPSARARPGQAVVWQPSAVTRAAREARNGHRGRVLWLTGLPGSGKTTLASALEARLHAAGRQVVRLDGDNLRHGLCADLGFCAADRDENVRRVGEVARLFLEQGFLVVVALVSPFRAARDRVRASFSPADFVEVHCRCPVETCRDRDPKGLYARADRGAIDGLTGVSSPYEPPLAAELVLYTDRDSVEDCVDRLAREALIERRA